MKEGVINIDKPAGWTSHDVVAKVRNILNVKKVGHTGTLDPDATGVLPVCFGKGTKVVSFLMNAEKEYDVVLRLGVETDTQDAAGKVLRSCPVPPDVLEAVRGTLEGFVGSYAQTPPMYSAVKVKGRPLYEAARAGEVIERAPRRVTLREIRFHKIEGSDVFFSVVCSKGTYIRTLCADIGVKLGVGGSLLRLRRTRSGNFRLTDSIEIEAFCRLYPDGDWEGQVYSLNEVLSDVPAVWIKERFVRKIAHGAPVGAEGILKRDSFEKGAALRLLDDQGILLALGTAKSGSNEIGTEKEGRFFFKIETVLSEADEPVKVGKIQI